MSNVVTRYGSPRAYLVSALLHPAHVVAVVGVVLFSLIAANVFALAAAMVLDLVYLRWTPRARRFQKSVDRQLGAAAEHDRVLQRERAKGQMEEARRRRVCELESVVEKIRDARGRPQQPLEGGSSVDPMELIDAYVALTVTRQGYQQLLSKVHREALSCQILHLQHELEAPLQGQVRWLEERRLSIARQRAALWDRTWAEADRISHQLAAIEELLELLHEQAIVSVAPAATGEQVDDVLREIDDSQAIDLELARLTGGRSLSCVDAHG